MRAETRRALRAINRRFYNRFAAEFDASRARPWPGWERAVDRLLVRKATARGHRLPAILDVGCGNGRFGAYLATRLRNFHYLGLDDCGALLRTAAGRLDGVVEAPKLRRLDVLENDLERALGERRFDLVALFGVLHHVPGADVRADLLRRLGRLLAPAGVLAASIWRLDRGERFSRLIVPWEAYRAPGERRRPIPDRDDLEAGDVLLSWGGSAEHPRYCHFLDDAEIGALVDAPGTPLADRFQADGPSGRDNLYLVWRRGSTRDAVY